MKPPVDAEARGVAEAAFLALINEHRATSGYGPLPDIDAVRAAYMGSKSDGIGERWLEHERRKSDAAVATALAVSQARVEDLERQVAERDLIVAALRADLANAAGGMAQHTCEGCRAPLMVDEDAATTTDVVGCWPYVTGEDRHGQCWRYRTADGSDRAWPKCALSPEVSP